MQKKNLDDCYKKKNGGETEPTEKIILPYFGLSASGAACSSSINFSAEPAKERIEQWWRSSSLTSEHTPPKERSRRGAGGLDSGAARPIRRRVAQSSLFRRRARILYFGCRYAYVWFAYGNVWAWVPGGEHIFRGFWGSRDGSHQQSIGRAFLTLSVRWKIKCFIFLMKPYGSAFHY